MALERYVVFSKDGFIEKVFLWDIDENPVMEYENALLESVALDQGLKYRPVEVQTEGESDG